MSPRASSFRVYWLAFVVYWGIVLFGYDTGVAGSVVAQTYFRQHFGFLDDKGNPIKDKVAAITSNIVSVLQAGAFFGALGSAPMSAAIGRRWTLIIFTLIFSVGAALTTAAKDPGTGLAMIYAGRVISGVGIGAISAVAPAFVSECAPKEARGRITGLFQITVAVGVMISYFINYGISLNPSIAKTPNVWRIPFGFQLVPAGLMLIGLFTVKESPRYLASKNRNEEALAVLAYLRRLPPTDESVIHELAEIEAAIAEEREARVGLGLREAFLGKGNLVRFLIAFFIFFLQQWGGQNTVGYYAPQIFASLGFVGTKNSLLASGIYGVVKVVATTIFVTLFVDSLGRRWSLFISAMGMGTFFFIIGALLKTVPPPAVSSSTPADQIPPPAPSSKAMAAMLYLYVCFYSMGWGPLPWVYSADIFPTRTRHYGMAVASGSQWLWNFVVSYEGTRMVNALGYKMFLMFATINVGAMATFSLLIPETKGRSLEDMDVIFGSKTQEERDAHIRATEDALGMHGGADVKRSNEGSVREDEKV
ncbi:general substrate transporter [Roridomyces roridus]|uniref:General substrate transporter n=1 Tax=Roridomyces roridus TaxID=1738132 RepID=A0AAD7BLH7_9AGAR|nr:general substrate transporter [Roridomyces roridus]